MTRLFSAGDAGPVAISTRQVWCLIVVVVCVEILSLTYLSYGQEPLRTSLLGARGVPGFHKLNPSLGKNASNSEPSSVGIIEEIPEKYKKRYEEWKKDFLSTETGQRQWEVYARNSHFLLMITMAGENRNGAATGKYKWDASGKLIAATIVLGDSLDHGYPNPIYYPVQNSLAPYEYSFGIHGQILAATKLAHEFGHVNRMSVTDSEKYHLQLQLIPVYNAILLHNGYKTNDPKLVDLERKMGGTPIELWEDREYWGEANAMLFLRDRFNNETFRCALFRRIERSVRLYARNYQDRFMQIAQSTSPSEACGWQ